jgi:ribonuclease-3
LDEVEALLGHRFSDPGLLRLALTHASSLGRKPPRGRPSQRERNNQRLEFLGDRVLGLVMAELLLDRYPAASEGEITSRSQVLVSTATLAEVARELGLGRWLRTDDTLGGRAGGLTPKVLADACEALIGALYQDGGLEPAARFIRRHWSERIEAMAEPPRDPKMALQEWALERGLPLPCYTTISSEGPPHAPRFRVGVTVEGCPTAEAEGSSKRRAEQAAAGRLLEIVRGS